MSNQFIFLRNPRFLIGLVLLIIVIFLANSIYNEISDFNLFDDRELTFDLFLKLSYNSGYFLYPLISVFGIIGFFISKPIGWILLNNLFTSALIYFIIVLLLVEHDLYLYLFGLIPVGLVLLMHTKMTLHFYKIKNHNLLTLNLLLIISGLTFALIKGDFILNNW